MKYIYNQSMNDNRNKKLVAWFIGAVLFSVVIYQSNITPILFDIFWWGISQIVEFILTGSFK